MRTKDEKPVLFWDFHGTLSLPDVVWFDAAMEAAAERTPHRALTREELMTHFSYTCLPWYSVPSRDTRHLTTPGAWWAHSEREFEKMFQKCGFTQKEAIQLAPMLRKKVLQPQRYRLYEDAIPTLQTLKQRGYRSFVLSNNYPELSHITDALGLSGLFEDILVSGKIGYDKPRPEIFAAARKAAGGAKNAWMIGDNPVDDIEGGNAAGFTTVAVHNNKAPASHSLGALGEILELLQ